MTRKTYKTRDYDIARRYDGKFNVWKWMEDPVALQYKAEYPEYPNLYIPMCWIVVAVHRSFQEALEWVKIQKGEKNADQNRNHPRRKQRTQGARGIQHQGNGESV